jgi:hypothetical protein
MEDWAKLLYTYGPFALLVLFVFVIERKVRAALTDSGIPRGISVPLYVLNWCTVFALCGAVTYFWAVLNLPHEITIQGTIENLKHNETFFSESDDLWLQRNYRSPGSYQWRLINSQKLGDGTKESFTIQTPGDDPDHDRAFKYELPVRPSFYNSRVRLRYDRNTRKLLVEYGGRHEELAPSEDLSSTPTNAPSLGLLPVVYAQSSPSLDDIFDRLESDDPIVRRDARRDLGAQGQAALPRVEKTLQDPKASYRLQLGALAALNLMQNARVSPETRSSIEVLYGKYKDSDPVFSSEAERYLHNLPAPTCGVRCGVERWLVKSLTDQDASRISLDPQEKTISQLIHLEPPQKLPLDRRVVPVEVQTYRVRGLLTNYKMEADHDFHIEIVDPHDVSQTMIVEIPDPECSNVCASPQINRIRAVRQSFDAKLRPSRTFQSPGEPLQVTVTGVGFFDFHHGQHGAAPNAIELHPVLDIEFGQ